MLRDTGQLSHALFPVLELLAGTSLFVLLPLSLGFFESLLNLLGPLSEHLFEVIEHVYVEILGVGKRVLHVLLVFGVIGLQGDVLSEGEDGFTDLLGETFESLHELLPLLGLTAAPVGAIELVDQWLVDAVDDVVEGKHGVLANLAEQNFVVVGTGRADGLARGRAPHKVDSLAFELVFLA